MEEDIFSAARGETRPDPDQPGQLLNSSTDLAVPNSVLLPLVSVYKVLTKHFHLAHLTFEDFCAGVAHHDHNSILSDVHIALLDELIAKDIENSSEYKTYDLLSLEKLDEVTWPCALRLYLQHSNNKSVQFSGDYYNLAVEKRVEILSQLVKSFHEYDEKSPAVYETPSLGCDSVGTTYWFVLRRLILHSSEGTTYFSSKDKLDVVLAKLQSGSPEDVKVHDLIREKYFDYVERMNETLVDFVFAYKTTQTRSLQSPTKYSGMTYGDQSNSTVLRKDVESMPLTSLLDLFQQATGENFTFGADKLYLKYKGKRYSDNLTAALSKKLEQATSTVREQLSWKSASPDQIKLLRNTLLNMSTNIPKYFMHDAWSKRRAAWENALLKAGNAHHLAACLAFLESHIRPVVFNPDWTRLAEPEQSKEGTSDKTEGENEKTEAEATPSETPAATTDEEESKPADIEMKDISESKPTSEEKGNEKEGEEKQEKQEVIPPPADSAEDMEVPSSNKRKSPRKVTRISVEGEEYRTNSGFGWAYEGSGSSTSPKSRDKNKQCARLTRIVNKLQCTKGGSIDQPSKRVISMPHGFKKIVGPDGKVMFALPAGAKIIRQKSVTQVIMSANSLTTGLPTAVQVIPSDQNKENKTPAGRDDKNSQRNIVLSKEVVQTLLKRTDLNIKGNVTLKRRAIVPTAKPDDPAQLLQRLFQSWNSQNTADIKSHSLPERKQRKLGRSAGTTMLHGYLYDTSSAFCVANSQNRWRMALRQSSDVADVGTLISMLHSHIIWPELRSLKVLTENQYVCDEQTFVQRIIVESRPDKNNELAKQYKIVVMKQKRNDEELQIMSNTSIHTAMLALEEGVHDIWVSEDMVTLGEAYTYLFNQEKLKSIESAKILEEKKKDAAKSGTDSLLPRWKGEESADKKYYVDSEISSVVRRVLTNILDRVEMEDRRDKERKGKRKKTKKPLGRLPGRSADEKEQIKYFGKLDILLGRRKEQLKKTFFKKRHHLAHMIREEIKFEEEENKRIADKIMREEEEELAEKRKKTQEADRRKKEKEKKIRKAQEKIEKKLQRLQKNVEEMKDTNVAMKKPKSPGRPTFKSPKAKKGSIRIEPQLLKPVYKNKLQPKTKFKFPPKKPVVKKSTGKLSLTPTVNRVMASPVSKASAPKSRIRLPSSDKPKDVEKILGKRKVRPGATRTSTKKLCVEITPVRLSKRKREALEQRLNKYQRSIARKLTSDDISHPVIEFGKKTKRPTLKLKQKSPGATDKNSIRERLQKLRKMASAKNRGNEVLAKLLMKQELVKKLAASQKQDKTTSSEPAEKRSSGSTGVLLPQKNSSRPGAGVMQHHKDQTNKVAPKKKDTLYCICKRPYDHTRFYIGCDVCSNWFHGKCVAISPSMARNMSGYTCDDCKAKTSSASTSTATAPRKEETAAEPEGDLFCICRTPYNQYSFYIGCDSCQEWYHGTCVGISEMEAEKIEVYICDRCKQQQGREEPKLTHIQIAGLIKILRELQMHKMSWPFREPGKSDSETDVIKEPMDLSTIHKKFQKKHYPKLTLFVKDVLRVFSNARQLYSEDSQRGRCADTLERYFVAKLNEFKLRHGLTLS